MPYVNPPFPEDVATHLDGDHQAAYTLARAMVYGYTRGRGFDEQGQVDPYERPDLAAVITTVAGRLSKNPTGLRESQTAGSFSHDIAGWQGFTMAEQVVLNRYRVRAR
ncbi:hypothetical protein [uncultured Citricoccus sp.]|uniref:hypothetical protein n=1 Tax=uncultured Citricoccus sp. TaxID=614031 RepID=UPI00261E6CAC|nr:hypothetical protein [uncultured Citricoccus sp.]